MRKSEINWAIFSGKALLPFSIRSTKHQCINNHIRSYPYRKPAELLKSETCKKIIINEYVK